MTEPALVLERRRTGWDVVLGALSIVAGIIALGHTVFASVVSVLFLGWTLLAGGVFVLVSGIVGWREPGHRSDVVVGVLLGVLGFGLVRFPGAGLLVLTLLAGSLLVVGGAARLGAAFQPGAHRGVLVLNGGITLLLGVMVLFRWPVSALWFLGTVLGVQLVLDGITTALVGRLRPAAQPSVAAPVPPVEPTAPA